MKRYTFTWFRTDMFEHTVEAGTEEEARKKFPGEKYENPKVYAGEDQPAEITEIEVAS
jgi:hypothetical protein|tara:strand:- start:560 stop:733 length:174 start_codon:yes stop_codon:yes gene_type:complete